MDKWFQVSYVNIADGSEYARPRTIKADNAAHAVVVATIDPLPPSIRDGQVECSARRVAVLDLDAYGDGSHEVAGEYELVHRGGEFAPFPRISSSELPLTVEVGQEDVVGVPMDVRRLQHGGRVWSGTEWRS